MMDATGWGCSLKLGRDQRKANGACFPSECLGGEEYCRKGLVVFAINAAANSWTDC
jgi:hypothetical protein